MSVNTLCANSDCSAFFDAPGVPHLDRDTRRVILLCRQCTAYVEVTQDTKYERLAIPPEIQSLEGASE